jgi:hypothetical protein
LGDSCYLTFFGKILESKFQIYQMPKRLIVIVCLVAACLWSCSKRNHPSRTVTDDAKNNATIELKKSDSIAAKKAIAKTREKVAIPPVITVNDSAAHKSIDGRYYYDVMGHRYWRNNVDGKYYLFNQSMYNNPAFKAAK